MDYDFSNLTTAQEALLTFQGWSTADAGKQPQPTEDTVKELIKRGLVVQHVESYRGYAVRTYEVPIAVHMAWCAYCSDNHRKRKG